jgi:hypothetical protein
MDLLFSRLQDVLAHREASVDSEACDNDGDGSSDNNSLIFSGAEQGYRTSQYPFQCHYGCKTFKRRQDLVRHYLRRKLPSIGAMNLLTGSEQIWKTIRPVQLALQYTPQQMFSYITNVLKRHLSINGRNNLIYFIEKLKKNGVCIHKSVAKESIQIAFFLSTAMPQQSRPFLHQLKLLFKKHSQTTLPYYTHQGFYIYKRQTRSPQQVFMTALNHTLVRFRCSTPHSTCYWHTSRICLPNPN